MTHYCYSVFAKELTKAARRPDSIKLPMAKALIGFLADQKGVVKEKDGEQYFITSWNACRWYEGKEQIPLSIQSAAQGKTYRHEAYEAIKHFCSEYLYDDKLESVCSSLYSPAETALCTSRERKEALRRFLDDGEYYQFLTEALMIALQQENILSRPKNELKKIQSFKDDMDAINFLIQKNTGKPEQILVPQHSTNEEINYVKALLNAYAEEQGVKCILEQELSEKEEYKRYELDFNEERKSFYQAESVREATRDSDIFNGDRLSFEGLKKEMREGLRESYYASYKNGYFRLMAVTQEAEKLEVTTLLAAKLCWINSGVKRGIVHIIINEDGKEWVRENDKQHSGK